MTYMNETNKRTNAGLSFLLGMMVMAVVGVSVIGGAIADRAGYLRFLNRLLPARISQNQPLNGSVQEVVIEENVVIDASEKASPSVVTVSITTTRRQAQPFFIDPFGLFDSPFGGGRQGEPQQVTQDIGSGFVVDGEQGLIVTNKHVVSETEATYKIITKDDDEYEVQNIYRDPANDLAILKVNAQLPQIEIGDSDSLRVGQFAIAIGTALGEFRHTVTTGVISGLGRGITAGDVYGGFAERLDNVIQTDAAINPGNSGGPLLNSAGQVIGVNVAVSAEGQNIGFAIPINVVKDSLENFNQTGQFERPFLGVRYRMIPRETALMNDVPEGAYIVEVVEGSSADDAGIEVGDIVTKLNGQDVRDADGGLAQIINSLKIGQQVQAELNREGESMTVNVTMKASGEE